MTTTAEHTHDWRDRLVEVDQGAVTTRLVVDPLGRLVARVRQTPEGDVARVYLHDGDQVVAEYVQQAGGGGWQLERRHHWGRWIDDLVAEEVDTGGDGVMDTTLYPVTDLLGSVQLLTGGSGKVVERVEYDPDGTPHVFGEDVTAPRVTRVAWTGDGTRPTGDSVEASAFEVGLSEWVGESSAVEATATLTPDGGEAVSLSVTLAPDGRGVMLAGASVDAGVGCTLHLEGLVDRGGNALEAVDLAVSVADVAAYEVLSDDEAPRVLAVLDAADGLYVVMDEPVVAADGVALGDAIAVHRAGAVVPGSAERVSAQVLRWSPAEASTWLVGGVYEVTAVGVVDLAVMPQGVQPGVLPVSFSHFAAGGDDVLVVYEAAGESEPRSESAFGVTSLFQGRMWDRELGMYYFRARWYLPGMVGFLEGDPLEHVDGSSRYLLLGGNTANSQDPTGRASFGGSRSLLGKVVEDPRDSLNFLFSRNIVTLWEYAKSGLYIGPVYAGTDTKNKTPLWYRVGRYDPEDVLAVIAKGDDYYFAEALADPHGSRSFVIGVPMVNLESWFSHNSFLQRVRITIAVVKYYFVNNNKLEEYRGEIRGLLRASRRINDYDYPTPPRELVEALENERDRRCVEGLW